MQRSDSRMNLAIRRLLLSTLTGRIVPLQPLPCLGHVGSRHAFLRINLEEHLLHLNAVPAGNCIACTVPLHFSSPWVSQDGHGWVTCIFFWIVLALLHVRHLSIVPHG